MKKQILVVEDERIVADDIKTSLLRLGYDVCEIAISGKERPLYCRSLKESCES